MVYLFKLPARKPAALCPSRQAVRIEQTNNQLWFGCGTSPQRDIPCPLFSGPCPNLFLFCYGYGGLQERGFGFPPAGLPSS
jgi:hypothetical protein